MRSQLLALTDELRRLKAEGERVVTVSSESLELLRAAVKTRIASPAGESLGLSDKSAVAAVAESRWQKPDPVKPAAAAVAVAAPVVKLTGETKAARWDSVRDQVLNDPVCRAHLRPGKQVVLGVGNLEADIFFCGEAPGAEEEIQGEPFVGPAGQLLTKMIQGMGLKREQVYIGNIMNWRPEMPVSEGGFQVGNRPPTAEEMSYCLPFLRAQLEIVQPKIIVALGATAAGGLLGAGTFRTLGEIKGRWHEFAGKPVMVTYHPSYILRNNSNRSKRGIWEDLLKVMERAGLPVSEKQRTFFL